MSSAKRLFFLGGIAFWLPEIVLYAWTRQELDGKLQTILLPSSLIVAYLLTWKLRPKRTEKPSAAIFMILGVVFLGTFAITIGSTVRGGGFLDHPGSTLFAVVLGTLIPIYAFIAATYDGSLYALILVSIFMPAMHLIFERKNWIFPPKVAAAATA